MMPESLEFMPEAMCKCFIPPINYNYYKTSFLGVDETNGRYANVSIQTCNICGSKWIDYAVEHEGFSRSGRWFRGIVDTYNLSQLTPNKVVEYLEKLDWYIYGGSYFSSSGKYGKGITQVDLMVD